jgi:signal transduction histidine kinase
MSKPRDQPAHVPPRADGLLLKLTRSHQLVALIAVGMLIVTLVPTLWLRSHTLRLANLRGPTVHKSMRAMDGVHRTLGELRGWVVLGDPEFKADRATTWTTRVDPAMDFLRRLSPQWADPKHRDALKRLDIMLEKLKEAQGQIEAVAQTPANEPARVLFTQEVQPLADAIIKSITDCIDMEKQIEAAVERKALLGSMADLRGAFTQCQTHLLDHLDNKDPTDEARFRTRLFRAAEQYNVIKEGSRLLQAGQSALVSSMGQRLTTYQTRAETVLELRKRSDWNVARDLLQKKAIPLADAAKNLLSNLSDQHYDRMKADAIFAGAIGNTMLVILAAMIIFLPLTARAVARRQARLITEPMAILSQATQDLVAGRLSTDIPIADGAGRGDEVVQLTRSFNSMRASLQAGADAVLTHDRELEQRNEELARSNDELQQFAYVASHDLQEPLRMVASYLQLLDRRYAAKLDGDAREFMDFAVDGAKRMQVLINDLLAYSRVGSHGEPFASVDVNLAIGEVRRNLKALIDTRGAQVACDPLPTVRGDRGQFVQLLQNLMANALKFCKDQPPRVHVGARRGEGEWVFFVEDNGIGIDDRYADRIFVIFQRLHSRQDYAGTGIGLAICKRIVERHHGRIWFEPTPGEGTTFHFTIPDGAAEPL